MATRGLAFLWGSATLAGLLCGSAAAQETDPARLRAEVEALRAADVAWRGVPWRSCLLEGLARAREGQRPALLWVFIDRPVDDARC